MLYMKYFWYCIDIRANTKAELTQLKILYHHIGVDDVNRPLGMFENPEFWISEIMDYGYGFRLQ